MKTLLQIAAGLLIAAFAMFILLGVYGSQMTAWLNQAAQDQAAQDWGPAGAAAGNAIADMIEVAFVPCLMIGALILVARFMARRRKPKAS